MNLFYHRNMFHTSDNTTELLMYLLSMGSPIRDAICKHLVPLTIIDLRYFIHIPLFCFFSGQRSFAYRGFGCRLLNALSSCETVHR